MRRLLAAGLAFLAAGLAVVAILAAWARFQLLDTDRFASAASEALAAPAVQELLAREITERVLEGVPPEAGVPSDQVEAAVAPAVASPEFAATFEAAVAGLHRGLATGARNELVLDLRDAGPEVVAAVASVDPRLADRVPLESLAAVEVSDEGDLPSLEGLDETAGRATLLAVVGAAVAGGLALALGRERALTMLGIGLVGGGAALLLGTAVIPEAVAGRLDDPGVQEAVDEILDRLFGDLRAAAWGVAALGAAVAALGWTLGRRPRTAILR